MTEDEAAEWMKQQVEERGRLNQEYAIRHLIGFGDERLVYLDKERNRCLGKKVLAAFRKKTPDVVYERADKSWRQRKDHDKPGRQQ